MSRIQLQNLPSSRLNSLFADLGNETYDTPVASSKSVPCWTWECDFEGNYTACSPEIESILGIPANEFLGNPISQFRLAPESGLRLKSALEKGTYPIEVAVNYVAKNGDYIPVVLNIVQPPLNMDENGKTQVWHGFARLQSPKVPIKESKARSHEHFPIMSRPAPRVKPKKSRVRTKPSARLTSIPVPSAMETSPRTIKADVVNLIELLNVDHDRRWSEDELLLIEQVAGQLALALENARLFQENLCLLEEASLRNEELTILNKIIGTASRSLELEEMLKEILKQLLSILDLQTGILCLIDVPTQKLSLVASQNVDEVLLDRWNADGLESALFNLILQRGEVILINNLVEESSVDVSRFI